MIPRSYSFQRIDVKVGNPNLVLVFKMNRSTQVRIYRDQLVLVNQCEKMFYNSSSFTLNYTIWYDMNLFFLAFYNSLPTFQLRTNSMLRVILDLAKSSSIISVITRSRKTWAFFYFCREFWGVCFLVLVSEKSIRYYNKLIYTSIFSLFSLTGGW